jgi:hypothetical protein
MNAALDLLLFQGEVSEEGTAEHRPRDSGFTLAWHLMRSVLLQLDCMSRRAHPVLELPSGPPSSAPLQFLKATEWRMSNILNFYMDDSGTRTPDRKPLPYDPKVRDFFALGGILINEEAEGLARKLYSDFC